VIIRQTIIEICIIEFDTKENRNKMISEMEYSIIYHIPKLRDEKISIIIEN
jgi:hypothetical protein